jgi:hypothetical protein
MKKKSFALFVLAFVFVVSCNNSENKKTGKSSDSKSPVDSLEKKLDEVHGAGMSKMGKLSRFQTQVEHLIDSIGKLSDKAKTTSAGYKTNLEALLNELKSAQDGMNKWMNEFNYDSAQNNSDVRVRYFESEKIKVTKMTEDMQSVIKKADSLLNKKGH